MIDTKREKDGSLTIILSRCNKFNDHEFLKTDGDILLEVCGGGTKDEKDAEYLVQKIRERLQLKEDD